MIKKICLISFSILFLTGIPAMAEKIPVKIEPIQVISTQHDEVEVGDRIDFKVKNDVIWQNKIYISKDTPVYGVVDFLHNNGWGGDSADIVFKTFYTKDVNGNKITIPYTLDINGKDEMANSIRNCTTNELIAIFSTYGGFIFRGAEIYIKPDTETFNLFIEK